MSDRTDMTEPEDPRDRSLDVGQPDRAVDLAIAVLDVDLRSDPDDREADFDLAPDDEFDQPVPFPELVWRRIVRRPTEWANRPWPTERVVKYIFTVFSLVVTTTIMMNVVHLSPDSTRDLVFDNTTPTGGDFGAHVWGPAYLRDNLLPSFQLNGWTMDWYGGLPAYRFYMVLPALAILLVDIVLPYGVAIKLVSVLGLLTMPAACWAFGRLAAFRHPMPELFAFAGLAFVLDESYSIYGGNLKSTMAGEFSFSIALSIAILALGVLAAGLRTGKYRVWVAVLIAAAAVSHGIVMMFVIVGALVLTLIWIDRTRLIYAATAGLTSVLLLAWWVGPFVLNHEYMTDMKYGARTDWREMYFPLNSMTLNVAITGLALFGFGMSIVRRNLNGAALGVIGLVFVVGVYLAQDSLPVISLLWNPRLLPFLYLMRYLLMMVGAVELLSLVWNFVRDRRAQESFSAVEGLSFAMVISTVVLLVLGWMFQELPGGGLKAQADGQAAAYSWGPFTATSTKADAQGDGWASYNFDGYQGRDQYYTEYFHVVGAMARIGEDSSLGCGRASWENHPDNGLYGTTMALMLLPHWTDSCIGSMEGLFFEASGTTPYHFLSTAAMSKQSSNPVRELRYVNNDADVGVEHLKDLGVRYAMVRSDEAKAEAATHPDLSFITSATPWDIYLVGGSDIVVPLDVQPVVVHGRGGDPRERNLEVGTSWFQHKDEWAAMPADDGPANWQRISVNIDMERREGVPSDPGRRVDIVTPAEPIQPVALPAVQVSNVDIRNQSLSFDVDQIGVPVLVRVSYFPNWNASGADGPYRVGPNMMVVVPQAQHVELTYGRSGVDYATIFLTLIGIGLCVFWRVRGDVHHESPVPVSFGASTANTDLLGATVGVDVSASGFPGAQVGSSGERALDDSPPPDPWWQAGSATDVAAAQDGNENDVDKPDAPGDPRVSRDPPS